MLETTKQKADAVLDYIAQTTGSDCHYRHHFAPMKYTDGVKFVAQTCQAYWLIDVVASYQFDRRLWSMTFQVWELTAEANGTWAIRCWSDEPGKSTLLAFQKLEYTTFPPELMPFRLWVEDGVLLLPAEH